MKAALKRILPVVALLAAALLAVPWSVFAQSTTTASNIRTNPGFSDNSIPANDDGSSTIVPLGFTINFFGRTRDSVYVNNNGNVTFDAALETYTPFGLEGTKREIIAAFFADVDTRPAGSKLVTYGRSTINGRPAFGVNYLTVGYYNVHSDKLNSFQLILIDRSDTGPGNFDIEFNYARIAWETGDASGGINGYGGVSASVGWSNGSGDPGTSWELEGSMIPGSFLDSAPRALARTRFNSTTTGQYRFRARDGSINPGLTIGSSCPVPNATVGNHYEYRFSAYGEKQPYVWSLLPDPGTSLPVSLSKDGLLSGDPKSMGSYNFTVKVSAISEDGEVTVARRCGLTVDPPQVGIRSTCPLPPAVAGAAYSQSLSASGGTPPYNWSILGSVAPGLQLVAGGTLSGTPLTPGTYLFTLQALSSDAGAVAATRQCSMVVRPSAPTPTISACPANVAFEGVPYSQTLGVSGGVAPYVWVVDGLLPTGMSMSAAGVISGIPGVVAPFSFGLRASDARGQTAVEKCTIFVSQADVKIATACPLPAAALGLAYSQQLRASGGSGPYTWSTAGALPAGLRLATDGTLSGTPSAAGPFQFRLLAMDAQGLPAGAACSLTVTRPAFSIASCPLPPGVAGESYAASLAAVGGEEPYRWSLEGSLPAGLTFSGSGRITGTPAAGGSYGFTLRALDGKGQSTVQACSLTVETALPKVASACPLAPAEVGKAYSSTLTAEGGTPPYAWFAVGGLPPGITLDATGVVSGLPVKRGDFEFTILGTDALNRAMAKSCSLAVNLPAPPVVRVSEVPAQVAPATSNINTGVELSAPYSLPVQGEATLSVAANTGNSEPELNRTDPLVRFANGQQSIRFTIPPGARRAALPIVSSGTVAASVTLAVGNLEVAGNKLSYVPSPAVFSVPRVPPVITSVCFASKTTGIELSITGYSTTRQLDSVEITAGATTHSQSIATASSDYYLNEESIRTGGAFTIALGVDTAGETSPASISVTLSNAAGKSASRTASRCP